MSQNLTVIKEQEVLKKTFRVYGSPEEPLFLARDVAELLGYEEKHVSDMLDMVDDFEKVKLYGTICYPDNGGSPVVMGVSTRWFVTEDGLYEILMQSRKPLAKEIKKQVKLILKQIRNTGGYIPISQEDDEESFMAKALIIAHKTLEKKDQLIRNQQQLIEEMQPKVSFADRLLKSKDNVLVREFSKILQDEGFTLGEKKLYKWLRENKYLMGNNEPYQAYMKYFAVIENTVDTIFGQKIVKTTKIRPEGQLYFYEKLLVDFPVNTLHSNN
jgi:phage antirepressor YoqD-like protein